MSHSSNSRSHPIAASPAQCPAQPRGLALAILLAAGVLLVGCAGRPRHGSETPGVSPDPDVVRLQRAVDSLRIDLSTPERAVRGYWAITDLMSRASAERGGGRVQLQTAAAAGGPGIGAVSHARTETREHVVGEITEVVQDGTDRAIVHARLRDVTGIRSGDPEPGARSRTQVRYVLARSGTEWRVIEVKHRWQ